MGQTTEGLILPHALDAERGVLSAAMTTTAACRWMLQHLTPPAFYSTTHRLVFQAIRTVFDARGTADVVLVGQQMRHTDTYAEAGGIEFFRELMNSMGSDTLVEHYGKLVLRTYYDRQVIAEAQTLKDEAGREDVLARIGQLFRARDLLEARGVVSLGESLGRVVDALNAGPADMMKTGYHALDQLLGGSEAGDLLTVGARTGVGKTAMLTCLAMRLAEAGKRVTFFAGEMGPDQVTKRALAARAQVDHWRVRTRKIGQPEAQRLLRAAEGMQDLPITYCSLPSPRLQDIMATCDAARADVAVIDYLTRCTLPPAENMRVSVNRFMVGLKNFARETGRIVFLAAQINRLTDKAPDGPPTLSDLKESGAIEEESDGVILLHVNRDDRHLDQPVALRLAVAKNRHGRTGACELTFDRRYMEVRDSVDQSQAVGVDLALGHDAEALDA